MKIAIRHALAAVVVILAAARPAVAADGDAAVVEALLRFVDALEAGDAKALEQTISAETSFHERARKTFVDMAVAQKALEKSAVAKFGEEGKKFRCGFDLIVNSMDRKTIASAKVKFEEGTRIARIEKTGELAPMELRRGQDGQWQVVLEQIEGEEDTEHYYGPPPYPQPGFGMTRQAVLAGIKTNRTNAIIEAFKQTAARIGSGELTTATAAQAELNAKLSAASADAAKARAAIPSGRMKGGRD
ncbi:MAG TPA: hypothetical protein VGP99_12690 [Tepidisphaeraceae bacterium]|jgi:hypothetical protein|nr:hypothetical protein [Tepidisphaeraceae bacterium]